MRKTSYAITFLAVAFAVVLNIVTLTRPDWLIVNEPEVLNTKIIHKYGLTELCTYKAVSYPSTSNKGKLSYSEYTCRQFPTRENDSCDEGKHLLCASWNTAGYFVDLAAGFGVVSLISILVGVSTGSRRRRIWRAVAGLVLIQAFLQLVAFSIVSDMHHNTRFPMFEHARIGTSYILNALSWVAGVITAVGVITTGISADKGHAWAAGNRAYRRIGTEAS